MSEELAKQAEAALNKAAKWRRKYLDAKRERDVLASQVDDHAERLEKLGSEYTDFKSRVETTPDQLAQEVDRLKGEIRVRDHRAAFEKLATAAKVRPEAIADLWALSKYTPETDLPDEKHLRGLIDDAKSTRGYLFDSSEPSKPSTTAPKPIPAPGRGAGSDPVEAGTIVTKAQLQDPVYMYYHQAEIGQAIKQGRMR